MTGILLRPPIHARDGDAGKIQTLRIICLPHHLTRNPTVPWTE